jgi:hypothetical protein
MKRNKDDKRVLRSGNGRQNTSGRKIRRSNNNHHFNSPVMSRGPKNRRRRKRKTSKTLMIFMIVALIAFVIGAGIGVSLSFDDGNDDQPQFENVTKEMTTGLNDTEQVYFDKEVDDVDFNENVTSQLDVQYKYSEDN